MDARLASHDSIPLSVVPRYSESSQDTDDNGMNTRSADDNTDDNGMNTRSVDDYQSSWNENRMKGDSSYFQNNKS